MLRIDGREIEKVKAVISWCHKDSFEQSNVLSVSKLRKRFDSLEIKSARPKTGASSEKKERSWQEIADAMESDGTKYGIRLNFDKEKQA